MVTLYLPGWSWSAENRPLVSVVRRSTLFVSRFLISTDAPGSAAPVASITVPWMAPPAIWACAFNEPRKNNVRADRRPARAARCLIDASDGIWGGPIRYLN